jgi:hypothetical protein
MWWPGPQFDLPKRIGIFWKIDVSEKLRNSGHFGLEQAIARDLQGVSNSAEFVIHCCMIICNYIRCQFVWLTTPNCMRH